jgi:biopolymer transport protein ExbB
MNFLDTMTKGGVTMWPILLCLVIAAYVVSERFFALRKAALDVGEFIRKLKSLFHRGEFPAVLSFCREKNTPVADIIRRGIEKHPGGSQKVREAIEIASRQERARLGRRIPLLIAVGGIAPLLGLLGTVLQLITLFSGVEAHNGIMTAGEVEGAVSRALLPAAFGLIVCIPALACVAYFATRVRAFGRDMEILADEFVEMLEEAENPSVPAHVKKPAPAAQQSPPEDDEYFRRKGKAGG